MSTKDLKQFFSKLSDSLAVLAREGRHVELETKLEALGELLDAWLDVAPPQADRPERTGLFALFDRFAGPVDVDLRELAKQGVRSGDSTTLSVLVNASARFAYQCINREQSKISGEYLDSLVFLYYQCRDNDILLDAVGTRLDSILDALVSRITYPQEQLSCAPDDTTWLVLHFAFNLVNAAIRLRQPQFAGYFVDRVLKPRERGMERRLTGESNELESSTAVVLDFAAVLFIGWSLEVLENADARYHQGAKVVLAETRGDLPSRERLIAGWELAHDDESQDSRLGVKLGVSNWDVRDWDQKIRTGVVTSRMGGGDWSKTGLRAALLLTTERSWQNIDEICGRPARRFTWNVNTEREALQKLAANTALAIPEGERQKRVEAVLELISQRSRGGDAGYLRYVLETPLSSNRLNSFQKQAIDTWVRHRSWIDAVGGFGLAPVSPGQMPQLSEEAVWVPREYLLDDNNWAQGFGNILGEAAGRRESVNLIGKLEDLADAGEDIKALALVPEVVRRSVRLMADRGFTINCVVLPQEDRFAGALFRKPLWKIEGRRQYGAASIGDWEGLHVLKCPYSDPKAILLIDTTKALAGTFTADPRNVEITIDQEPEKAEVKKRRDAAKRAVEEVGADLPESSDIVVLARMKIRPTLGIADETAVIKLSIENSDGGFAVTADSDLYHRPSCPEIAYEDVEYVLRAPKRSGKKPCPKCRPDNWNLEGRRGEADREEHPGE
ncbi:MAG: hypothetical protein NXI14_08775 [bacterium]|nr:hypothetical protein [bacterium]